MTRCDHCGKEVEAGQNFCPYCAQPLQAAGAQGQRQEAAASAIAPSARERGQFLQDEDLEPPRAVPFTAQEPGDKAADGTRRKVFVGVAVLAALLALGFIYMVTRPRAPRTEPRLEGAIRSGTPEFEELRNRLVVEFNPNQDVTESPRALGDIVMTATPTVRNFTGRTISGLEFHGAVLDPEGKSIKERTVVRQEEISPNRTLKVPIGFEGFKQTDVRADVKVELTGVRFK